jgi:uncharacterized membrane protein YqjE
MADPMVRPASSGVTDQSIGDLVSVAARDISQLVRYELDLAKLELKSDAKRLGMGAALGAIAAFAACLLLMLLSFALAYGISTALGGGWLWLSFIIAAGACLLILCIAAFVAYRMVKRLDGMSKTRRSLADGASLLRRDKSKAAAPKATVRAG